MYMGVSFGGNSRSFSFGDFVVEKISKHLDNWKGAYFSLGGRITLIQSCISSIPFYLSLFRISMEVANTVEKIMRNFLWSSASNMSRGHLVS